MTREPGPREKALRGLREAKQIRAQMPIERQARIAKRAERLIAVAIASQKRGKPRKQKK